MPPQPIATWVQLRYAFGHFLCSAFEKALHNWSLEPIACGSGSASTLGLSLKRALAFALILFTFSVAFAQDGSVPAAAKRFFPGIKWKPASVVIGDFSCQGRIEQAVLGTTKTEIVVAVFIGSLARAPKLLRFSATSRDPATSELTIEDGDFDPAQFEREVGYIPDGMRPSKTCKGLNLSDGNVDSAHIYWNHNAKQFTAWVL